jgi:nicotinamidase-related amidase
MVPVVLWRLILGISKMTATLPTATDVETPEFIRHWVDELKPLPLAEVVSNPAAAAVFSTDMTVGFCDKGALASPRVDALTGPVVDLFERSYALGVRHFVLVQDTHDPAAPEFEAWPVHCVRGTDEAEMISELRELPFSDIFTVVEKNSLHPGLETDFDRWVDAHQDFRTAIVIGDCTDLCVYQMAMHLRLLHNARNVSGVRVIVPANAVQTYDLPESVAQAAGVMPHPGDFFHQTFLYHMGLNGIEVVRSLT